MMGPARTRVTAPHYALRAGVLDMFQLLVVNHFSPTTHFTVNEADEAKGR